MNRKKFVCRFAPVLLLMLFFHSMSAYAYYAEQDSVEALPDLSFASRYLEDSEPAAPELPPQLEYRVAPGDTLYKIARSFGVDVQDLMAENSLENPNRLSVGSRLQIPPTALTPPQGQKGVVQRVISTTLTAYTAGYESTGKKPDTPGYGITYSGNKVQEGRTIAVDPSVIPLGSTVYIDGIGIRQAEDIGSAIRGSRIDVYMNDLAEAKEFGVKKNVKVYVLSTDTA
ncbi:LysM peptidoglycan-binding domain-containing protein [Paenibacillus sp. P25]|nr:LysM peptidoglycan-binding domain-containing protein [Paenibacillus sp. P25]